MVGPDYYDGPLEQYARQRPARPQTTTRHTTTKRKKKELPLTEGTQTQAPFDIHVKFQTVLIFTVRVVCTWYNTLVPGINKNLQQT